MDVGGLGLLEEVSAAEHIFGALLPGQASGSWSPTTDRGEGLSPPQGIAYARERGPGGEVKGVHEACGRPVTGTAGVDDGIRKGR